MRCFHLSRALGSGRSNRSSGRGSDGFTPSGRRFSLAYTRASGRCPRPQNDRQYRPAPRLDAVRRTGPGAPDGDAAIAVDGPFLRLGEIQPLEYTHIGLVGLRLIESFAQAFQMRLIGQPQAFVWARREQHDITTAQLITDSLRQRQPAFLIETAWIGAKERQHFGPGCRRLGTQQRQRLDWLGPAVFHLDPLLQSWSCRSRRKRRREIN